MKIFFYSLIASLLFAPIVYSQEDLDQFDETFRGHLNPTIYYTPIIDITHPTCEASSLKAVLDPRGQIITKICRRDHQLCSLQGACIIQKYQERILINYASQDGGTVRFAKMDMSVCKYGFGMKSVCLDPFYNVAADPKHWSAGDVIFVPHLVNTRLPNGTLHDGYMIVRDTGGAIKGAHRFDFFIGYSNNYKESVFFELGFSDKSKKFPYSKVTGERADLIRRLRNYPRIP